MSEPSLQNSVWAPRKISPWVPKVLISLLYKLCQLRLRRIRVVVLNGRNQKKKTAGDLPRKVFSGVVSLCLKTNECFVKNLKNTKWF